MKDTSTTAWSSRPGAVQVYLSTACNNNVERVVVCDGTRAVAADDGDYEDGARVPKLPWRALSDQERAAFVSPVVPRRAAFCVSIVKAPESVMALTRAKTIKAINDALHLSRASDLASVGPRESKLRELNREIEQAILATYHVEGDLRALGVNSHSGDLFTVTRSNDPTRGNKYIGLHVDSWENRPAVDRALSGNRICINIGAADRFLLFMPIAVAEMVELLREQGDKVVCERLPNRVVRRFLTAYPHAPVLRCRIASGEAYIAPTENVVHDGSSQNQQQHSVHMTFLGGWILPRH